MENTEAKDRLAVGRAWEKLVGAPYKYYLVFEEKGLNLEGAYPFDGFIRLLKQL